MEKSEYCQYYYGDLILNTYADARLALPLRRYWWTLKKYVWYTSILGPLGFAQRMLPFTSLGELTLMKKRESRAAGRKSKNLNLQRGDWVQVRSVKEIFGTLDQRGKLRGLQFTPEMVQFCGKRLRVYKKLDRIILEATGELRKIKTPTVLLEGVFCDGKAHGGCDRSCFCFWREEWLRRIDS
jgi:hypothetical protein